MIHTILVLTVVFVVVMFLTLAVRQIGRHLLANLHHIHLGIMAERGIEAENIL